MDSTTSAAVNLQDGSPNTTAMGDALSCYRESGTPGCVLYSFVTCTVMIGLLAVFGSIGNIISFIVFCRDKIKTSTTFLFQVASESRTSLPLYGKR